MSAAPGRATGRNEPERRPRRRIKKVAAHGGHHGGSWKVAYADFVTAMMALFLVLWLLSQADTKLKESIANYFRSPGAFNTQAGGVLSGPKKLSREPGSLTQEEEQMLAGIGSTLKKLFSTRPEFSNYKDRVKIDMTEEGLRIQIVDKTDQVAFESGRAELNNDARQVLAEIAHSICGLPNFIAIGGHTDKHLFPQGSTYSNWELSADRANAARRALEVACVKPEQIRKVVGYADTELLYPNQPYSPANRRINIVILRAYPVQKGASTKPVTSEEPATEKGESSPPALARPESAKKAEPSVPKASPAASLPGKPSTGKTISVGTPDEIPANVKRVRE